LENSLSFWPYALARRRLRFCDISARRKFIFITSAIARAQIGAGIGAGLKRKNALPRSLVVAFACRLTPVAVQQGVYAGGYANLRWTLGQNRKRGTKCST
jgi:hypothetical protein